MIRQTGGLAPGETSTRSSPASSARAIAASGVMTPSCSPSSAITRISDARIIWLIRGPSFLVDFLNSGILRSSTGRRAGRRSRLAAYARSAADTADAVATERVERAFACTPTGFVHEHGWCMAIMVLGCLLDRWVVFSSASFVSRPIW
jgi:hypothetical protein